MTSSRVGEKNPLREGLGQLAGRNGVGANDHLHPVEYVEHVQLLSHRVEHLRYVALVFAPSEGDLTNNEVFRAENIDGVIEQPLGYRR